jgi:hypothetical protein
VSVSPTSNNNEFEININRRYGTYSSIDIRNQWRNDSLNWQKEWDKNKILAEDNIKIVQASITNLSHEDSAITLQYKLKLTLSPDKEVFYINPYLFKNLETNPFESTTRIYPIAMDYKEDNKYVINFQLNNEFIVEEYPNSANFMLNEDNEIGYKNAVRYKDNMLNINSRFQINKTNFYPEEYTNIKKIYDNIIDEQNKNLVIRRVKK